VALDGSVRRLTRARQQVAHRRDGFPVVPREDFDRELPVRGGPFPKDAEGGHVLSLLPAWAGDSREGLEEWAEPRLDGEGVVRKGVLAATVVLAGRLLLGTIPAGRLLWGTLRSPWPKSRQVIERQRLVVTQDLRMTPPAFEIADHVVERADCSHLRGHLGASPLVFLEERAKPPRRLAPEWRRKPPD
jgi:hypothetical protein